MRKLTTHLKAGSGMCPIYMDSTRGDDVTSSELVNGGTIHNTVSMKTMTLLGEGVAGVGRNVWSGGREYSHNKL